MFHKPITFPEVPFLQNELETVWCEGQLAHTLPVSTPLCLRAGQLASHSCFCSRRWQSLVGAEAHEENQPHTDRVGKGGAF